ncbi:Dihydrolipoyllysine-residue acetyltransferase component of pyruvate dehydrogenase complex [Candidatus Portiera aleyrodidarum]|uniref:Dihydrolipoamide acetyltransferase component of pyruvate dehydrogenase complex n=1 Tax=Candidatus Portiera aleyrodidarum TV TaxID=1297582 RepID=A0A8D4BPL4_9GAMM|nr:2-oxo acid dehydrogenase subunit E2 [Candidatus Portiera aleyrodidarum]AGI27155.1 pyruvate/2-oxoglutarate dehydrogenase complex, dihydrolipoamide acyltransferase component [Candidatus Portiera aleyrodidarum TV]CEI59132.1 Dihydrolipoyllysine-residue acetyltransferase component of pyruvate dehydrogenase complex [Candidatus Portiera aleyrodidarum]
MIIKLPAIGDINKKVEVIEIPVKVGDVIKKDDTIVVLESEKATIDLPSPKSGKIKNILIKEGDKIYSGNSIIEIEEEIINKKDKVSLKKEIGIHAGPAVRLMARKIGIDLAKNKIIGSGNKNCILKEDIQKYINTKDIEEKHINNLLSISAKNLQNSWRTIPHVTHFDEIDVTKVEKIRKKIKYEIGIKITLLSFLIKVCSCALKQFYKFNMFFDIKKNKIILKKYINISIAMNTSKGLLVPVIKHVDKKNIIDIALELKELTKRTLLGKNKIDDMIGGCFTISNLGIIGGQGFTPIINSPEVGILGIGKNQIKPIWNGKEFKPKIMLPICISYDHRFINGVYAAKFLNFIIKLLDDIRNLIIY